MSITIDNLTHDYGCLRALDGVTCDARSGAITTIIGPNASGKSTLLRCVIGAIQPTSGEVRLDDQVTASLSASALAAKVAYVPQRSTCSARFTVRQIVSLGRYALPADPGRIDSAMEDMAISNLSERPLASLSVGQQQRVTLARALAQVEPQGRLVLDEPTSAMDLRHARLAAALLRERADAGMTILVAVHDLTLAAGLADDVLILNRGRLVIQGPAREVMTPQTLGPIFGVRFVIARDDQDAGHLVPCDADARTIEA